MKVLFINKTYSKGGAAIAARQIAESVMHAGADVRFLVQGEPDVVVPGLKATCKGALGKMREIGLFLAERVLFLNKEKSKELRYAFSPAFAGQDISTDKLIKWCDIIHIHWFNQGFLSASGLQKILESGKPIVWTLHDMWAFTGGCHYAWDCMNYLEQCGQCQFLKSPSPKDLSNKIWLKKSQFYPSAKLTFVPVGKWLGNIALSSSLGKHISQQVIYNPIDLNVLQPIKQELARKSLKFDPDVTYVLFGASRIDDRIKGLNYLIDAIEYIKNKFKLVVFGGKPKFRLDIIDHLPVEVIYLGHVTKEEQQRVYSACDVTCVPSEYETFGLVAAESMACGTPVVAFDNSGVAEIVDHHRNGYLAEFRSSEDLAKGIDWVLDYKDQQLLREAARQKIVDTFAEDKIGQQYFDLYNRVLTNGTNDE